MGHGFKHGASGGVAKEVNPLNFTVIAYPSEVELNTATADGYTIGVVTTNPIKGWCFTVEQPENMAEGEIWFSTGISSNVAFNALKENAIMVYPISAKQMVSGTLVDVTAKSWQDGAWVDWFPGTYLFNKGDQCTAVTGGWTTVSGYDPGVISGGTMKVEGLQTFSTSKAISKGNNTKLYVKADAVDGNYHTFIINRTKGGLTSETVISEVTVNKGTVYIDLTNAPASFYAMPYIAYGEGSMTISEIWME